MPNRTTFYFDGFNFYNGLKSATKTIDGSWRKYYWLDFAKFCQSFLGSESTLTKIKYFSAPPLHHGKQARQHTLFKANASLNSGVFEVIKGKYYKKDIYCPHCKSVFQVPEEKRTDVNISVEMIGDCHLDLTDTLVLVSGDSDLVPSVEFIQKHFPNKKVKVYFPPTRQSSDLHRAVNKKTIYLLNNKNRFDMGVMPHAFTDANGIVHNIPPEWIV